MCGVIGFIDKKNQFSTKKKHEIIAEMLVAIRHRGGDSVGVEVRNNIAMGHTRLAIVDQTSKSSQPVKNDKSILSYNGEIYNYKELSTTYGVQSHSDTLTLFEILNTLPVKTVLKELQGMFAFSYFDKNTNLLTLAIDKYSIKPLYYINTPNFFAWSSEVKAFKKLPGFTFEFNSGVLAEYLTFRYIFGKSTLFKNIYKLQQGEYIDFNLINYKLVQKKYHNLVKHINNDKIIDEEKLNESVKKSMIGDLSVGIQLSGGIDSSLVAFFAQKHSSSRLHTFSIGLKDKKWNEFMYSDSIAKILGTIHHKIIFDQTDFADLLPKITYNLDEPVVHPNTIPMYILAKKARKFTKVLLTGEGADELFFGYRRYLESSLLSETDVLMSNSFGIFDVANIFDGNLKHFLERRKKLLQTKGVGNNLIIKTAFYDMYTYLPHVLLRQDKAGMAANIENRIPFLSAEIVESGFNPKNIGEFGGKTPLKKIALKYFPKNIVLRNKCGFGLPLEDWLRDKKGLLPQLLALRRSHFVRTYLHHRAVNNYISEHLAGKDHSQILFTLVSLNVWYKKFIS